MTKHPKLPSWVRNDPLVVTLLRWTSPRYGVRLSRILEAAEAIVARDNEAHRKLVKETPRENPTD
ncbi:unnamed protein product [marine sediment metagenome]|uniref:Uncharacterized protein n=1 Tax=marine sediment metagenome TaxID=412755 RepID=X1N582_9ZZZZ